MNTNQLNEILEVLVECKGIYTSNSSKYTPGSIAKIENSINYVKDELLKDFKPRKFIITKECKRKGYTIIEIEPGIFNVEKVNENLTKEEIMHDLYYNHIKEIPNHDNEQVELIEIIDKEMKKKIKEREVASNTTKNVAYFDDAIDILEWISIFN